MTSRTQPMLFPPEGTPLTMPLAPGQTREEALQLIAELLLLVATGRKTDQEDPEEKNENLR